MTGGELWQDIKDYIEQGNGDVADFIDEQLDIYATKIRQGCGDRGIDFILEHGVKYILTHPDELQAAIEGMEEA